jgi:addiction module HigA family antidote
MQKAKTHLFHPGQILKLEFLEPMGLSVYRVAKDVHVTAARLNEVVQGKRSISADTAARLGAYFGMPAQFWMNLQTRYDLSIAEKSPALKEIRPYRAA